MKQIAKRVQGLILIIVVVSFAVFPGTSYGQATLVLLEADGTVLEPDYVTESGYEDWFDAGSYSQVDSGIFDPYPGGGASTGPPRQVGPVKLTIKWSSNSTHLLVDYAVNGGLFDVTVLFREFNTRLSRTITRLKVELVDATLWTINSRYTSRQDQLAPWGFNDPFHELTFVHNVIKWSAYDAEGGFVSEYEHRWDQPPAIPKPEVVSNILQQEDGGVVMELSEGINTGGMIANIYNLDGDLLSSRKPDVNGRIVWDGIRMNEEDLSLGLYFFEITQPNMPGRTGMFTAY